MGSHQNEDHATRRDEFLKELKLRGEIMSDLGANTVANRKSLLKWQHDGIHCELLEDDRQGILRISAGGGEDLPIKDDYCRIRGDVGKCIALLERCIVALKKCPE